MEIPKSPGDETIMLIEDEDEIRNMLGLALKNFEYEVVSCSDAADAQAYFMENPSANIDLVIADINLPGMTGPEFAEWLAAMNKSFEILYMSGYSQQAVISDGSIKKGANFLAKPFRPSDLAQKIRSILDKEN